MEQGFPVPWGIGLALPRFADRGNRGQQLANLLVAGLRKIIIPLADRLEGIWFHQHNHIVRLIAQTVDGVARGDGGCDHDPLRTLVAEQSDGRRHGGAGGDAIIHDDDRASRDLRHGSAVAIEFLPAGDFPGFPLDRRAHLVLGET